MEWKCPVCGKEFEYFDIKDFASAPKTTLFGTFKIKDINGNIKIVDRKLNKPVCSEECKQKNENQYFVEKYKENNIYCVMVDICLILNAIIGMTVLKELEKELIIHI